MHSSNPYKKGKYMSNETNVLKIGNIEHKIGRCKYCNAEKLETRKGSNYCNSKCSSLSRKTETKVCPVCKKQFNYYPKENQKTCSISCGRKYALSKDIFENRLINEQLFISEKEEPKKEPKKRIHMYPFVFKKDNIGELVDDIN